MVLLFPSIDLGHGTSLAKGCHMLLQMMPDLSDARLL